MKKVVILFLGMFIFSISFAKNGNDESTNSKITTRSTSISGKVLDKITGEVLAGVKISVQGSEKSVYTDFDGNFEINGVNPGDHKLTASYISYKEKVENINIDQEKFNQIHVLIESLTE